MSMREKLTCEQARRIDLVQYLETLGYYPQRICRTGYWYLSPLRQERTASFKVDGKLNLWYDHGIGKGGSLIDFGILYFNCPIGELLNRLTGHLPASRSFHLPLHTSSPGPREQEGKIRIVSAGSITHDTLKRYLATRKIDEEL